MTQGRARKAKQRETCQTLSGPLPRSGSPARVARGAAAAAPISNEILLNVEMGRNARQRETRSRGARSPACEHERVRGPARGSALWFCFVFGRNVVRIRAALHSSKCLRTLRACEGLWPGQSNPGILTDKLSDYRWNTLII